MDEKDFIIVESGATKSDWRLVDGAGNTVKCFVRPGMNVSTMRLEDVKGIISSAFSEEGLKAGGFYMYTAGVVTEGVREGISSLVQAAGVADVDVQDDLMGAARAVCGHSAGVAAILGTGSNACFYDGRTVERKVYSGGFILGDEGGGATLGKLFLSDYLKGLVPEELASAFGKEFDPSYQGIVGSVYRSDSPSAYLGSLAPFLLRHIHIPYVKGLVEGNFRSFAVRMLKRYDVDRYPVGIVGGFAWACRDVLLPILEDEGIKVSRIIRAPIEGLCAYHA